MIWMLDFLIFEVDDSKKRGAPRILPDFTLDRTSDLMIRGGDFYAIWDERRGVWSTEEGDAIKIIDRCMDEYAIEYEQKHNIKPTVAYMRKSSSKMIDRWHKYCQQQRRDTFHMLDEKLIFSNSPTNKEDYASKRLDYPLESGDITAFDKLMSTLYSEEERHKLEWAIGSVVSGDSKSLQKFVVLYGAAGTGKSTILNIIQKLFKGYYSVFDAKALGSAGGQFALESFKCNPLVAIQHDGDLSKIEDNTRLNSLVSHEQMTVNEKFKSAYTNSFKAFLFMGTNKPVKITDSRSGLMRRLIDVAPSGKKLSQKEYNRCMKQVDFELGAIAFHCLEVYKANPNYYDDYTPTVMMVASNNFFNFILDNYFVFKKEENISLSAAWKMYDTYCTEAKISYPYERRVFSEELKSYFWKYEPIHIRDDGSRVNGWFIGFRTDKFDSVVKKQTEQQEDISHLIDFQQQESVFDKEWADYPAQLASDKETPLYAWDNVKTTLADIDTSKLHYVRLPINHIVIDFDIPDENGEKSFERNLEAASEWPPTYAELSKSGKGIHLHYIYTGDAEKLARVYADHIEVKVWTGKMSLRRKLTKCNNLPIATISSNLPLKGEEKVVNFEAVKSEAGLRKLIKRNLNKEIHAGTKPSIDFIHKILEDAYNGNTLQYDVSDMRGGVLAFAANSTNHAEYCIALTNDMKFKSAEAPEAGVEPGEAPIAFYDVEVFPNLFIICYKIAGEGKPVQRLINPSIDEVEHLMHYRLIGFNCRSYDNHILYAAVQGYTNIMLYKLSQKIINSKKGDKDNGKFGQAYNISYTDILDFASAGNKKSLKKLEIEMGIHHQELGLPWDEPVDEKLWGKVASYCDNDVIATEAAFHYLSADWTARQILADLAGMTVNDTTNSLTTRIIFGTNKNPQGEFCYRDMSKPVMELDPSVEAFLRSAKPEMMAQRHGKAGSLLPYFEGYVYDPLKKMSIYRDVDMNNPDKVRRKIGEGGYVYSEPGMYGNVALLDVSSMHPNSLISECLFGVQYTKQFKDIVDGRVDIKHEAWDAVDSMLDGRLRPYIVKVKNGEMSSGDLANGLKTAINAVYGQTSASYPNPFNDPRNKDNIVAKRGALFMIDLRHEVQKRGFVVAHIKTDSIKIPDATPEIIQFVMDFGKRYGYNFEHEATYDRMCLVNKAVYIAKYASKETCEALYGYVPDKNRKKAGKWDATGAEFQVPYVFKTLFSKEPLDFNDFCMTFETQKGDLRLDINEHIVQDILDKAPLELIANYGGEDHIYNNPDILEKVMKKMKLEVPDEQLHDLKFVGRVGQFCPIKTRCNGGILYAVRDGSLNAAPGTKGYRWRESEDIRVLDKVGDIDEQYFDKLAMDAEQSIRLFGDYDWFVSDEPYVSPSYNDMGAPVYETELPFI